MFTGIVQKKGRIEMWDLKEKWGRLALRASPWATPVEKGESVAVQGICLTVTSTEDGLLHFDVLRETFEKTNLGQKQTGDALNMERSLRWGEPMGGHIVVGHVDGVGTVRAIEPVGRDWTYEFACSPELMASMVYKGSVAIDGVSLTVASLSQDAFRVHIIPFTYHETTFGDLRVGDRVNLEADLLGKYVRRLVERGALPEHVTWEGLRQTGLIAEAPPAQ